MSQTQLAQKANVSRQAISQLENGELAAPRIDTLMSIADALGVGLDELLHGPKGRATFRPYLEEFLKTPLAKGLTEEEIKFLRGIAEIEFYGRRPNPVAIYNLVSAFRLSDPTS